VGIYLARCILKRNDMHLSFRLSSPAFLLALQLFGLGKIALLLASEGILRVDGNTAVEAIGMACRSLASGSRLSICGRYVCSTYVRSKA
jgi:hypothetical protein